MVLRIKLHICDLAIDSLLQIIKINCGSFRIQYRCLKPAINFHINEKVHVGTSKRNCLINLDK